MRSRDRLAELQRAAGPAPPGGAAAEGAPAHRPDIEHIFTQVERMLEDLRTLDDSTRLVRTLHADPAFHACSDLQERLDEAAARGRGAAAACGGALRRLEQAAAGAAPAGPNDACARIARLQYACARAHFAAALSRHHDALQTLRDTRLALLHKQIQLTELDVTEEECEALLESRNLALFVDNVRAETAEARRVLRDVEARHAALARLEGALADVRDLFAHLALLVATQGERVDSVEYYALQASEHVESGQRQLLKGTVSRKKSRKKKLSLILCLSGGFLIVLLVLLAT